MTALVVKEHLVHNQKGWGSDPRTKIGQLTNARYCNPSSGESDTLCWSLQTHPYIHRHSQTHIHTIKKFKLKKFIHFYLCV